MVGMVELAIEMESETRARMHAHARRVVCRIICLAESSVQARSLVLPPRGLCRYTLSNLIRTGQPLNWRAEDSFGSTSWGQHSSTNSFATRSTRTIP